VWGSAHRRDGWRRRNHATRRARGKPGQRRSSRISSRRRGQMNGAIMVEPPFFARRCVTKATPSAIPAWR